MVHPRHGQKMVSTPNCSLAWKLRVLLAGEIFSKLSMKIFPRGGIYRRATV
jgi:hypothetical protein